MPITKNLATFLHDMVERVHWREESERNSAHDIINGETESNDPVAQDDALTAEVDKAVADAKKLEAEQGL